MDWDSFLQMTGVESQEAYDADQRKNIEEAVRTQFILDAIADAREVTVDNEDLSAQIMAQAQRNRMSPEQYAQQLQQRSEEHTSELQSRQYLVCRLLLEKKKQIT